MNLLKQGALDLLLQYLLIHYLDFKLLFVDFLAALRQLICCRTLVEGTFIIKAFSVWISGALNIMAVVLFCKNTFPRIL